MYQQLIDYLLLNPGSTSLQVSVALTHPRAAVAAMLSQLHQQHRLTAQSIWDGNAHTRMPVLHYSVAVSVPK